MGETELTDISCRERAFTIEPENPHVRLSKDGIMRIYVVPRCLV